MGETVEMIAAGQQSSELAFCQDENKVLSVHTKCILLTDVLLTTIDVLCEELILRGHLQSVDGATGLVKRQQLVEFLLNFYRTYNEKLEELTARLRQMDMTVSDTESLCKEDGTLTKIEQVSFKDDSVQVHTDIVCEVIPVKKRRVRSKAALKQPPPKERVIKATEEIQTDLTTNIKEETDEKTDTVPEPVQFETTCKRTTTNNIIEALSDGESDTDYYDYQNDGTDSEDINPVPPKKKRKIKNPRPVTRKRAKPPPKNSLQKKSQIKSKILRSNRLKKVGLKNKSNNKIKKEKKDSRKTSNIESVENRDVEKASTCESIKKEFEETGESPQDDEGSSNGNISKIFNRSRSSEVQEDDPEGYERLPMSLKIHEVRDVDIYFKVRGSDPVLLMCRVCAHQTTNNDLMVEHIHTHTGERPYVCLICDRSYIRKKHLRRHELSHTGVKPNRKKNYHCDICSSSFDCKSKLNEHRAGHTGEKPHQCKLCDFATRFSKNLRNHMDVMHPSIPRERKYMCDKCDRAYLSHNTLRAHIKDCHDTEIHVCEVCGKNFGSWSGLREHYLSHRDRVYQCPYCEFRTNRPKTLKVHKTKHFDRKIQCDICGKILRSIASLKNHLKVMHGPNSAEGKLFSCLFCGASYDGRRKMSAHMRKHKRKLTQQGSKDAEFAMTHFVAIPKNSTLETNLPKKPTAARRPRLKNKTLLMSLTTTPTTVMQQDINIEPTAIIETTSQTTAYNLQDVPSLNRPSASEFSASNSNDIDFTAHRLDVTNFPVQETAAVVIRPDSAGAFSNHGNQEVGSMQQVRCESHVENSCPPPELHSKESSNCVDKRYSTTTPTNAFPLLRHEGHTNRGDSVTSYNTPQDSNVSRSDTGFNQTDIQRHELPSRNETIIQPRRETTQVRHDVQIQGRHESGMSSTETAYTRPEVTANYNRNEAIMNRAVSMMHRQDISYNRPPIMMAPEHTGGHLDTLEAVNMIGFPSPSPYMSPWVPSGYPNYHPP